MGWEHMFDEGGGSGSGGPGSDPLGLTALVEGAAKVVGSDPALESDETLMAAAVALEDVRNLVEGASARVLGRLEATGGTDVAVGMRTGSWLAWEADASRSRCRSRAGVAKRLGWFPVFEGALADRRVSYLHVEVLCNVANRRNREGLAAVQEPLVEMAARLSFEEWAQLVRRLASDLDQDGSYDPNEDLDANRLRVSAGDDCTVDLSGRLTGDTAVTVNQTLAQLADELFGRFKRDAEQDPELSMPPRSTLMALALGEACRRALATEVDSTRQPRVEATVVIDTDGDGKPVVSDLAGNPISDPASRALLIEPVVRAMAFDAEGVPLRLGRKVRLATPDQKHALALRDGGCIFPGCDAPPNWCDAHHQPGWQQGGTSDIESMFLGCRHHHVVTHRAGWIVEENPDRPQEWIWTTPSGRRLNSERQHRRPRPG